MRVLGMLLHLTSGHVTLYKVNFTPLELTPHRTYGAGRLHVGLCPMFLVLIMFCYSFFQLEISEVRGPISGELCHTFKSMFCL